MSHIDFKKSKVKNNIFSIYFEGLSQFSDILIFKFCVLSRMFSWSIRGQKTNNKPIRFGIVFSNVSVFMYFMSWIEFFNYWWLDWVILESTILFCNGSWRSRNQDWKDAVRYSLKYQYDPIFTPIEDLYCDVNVLKQKRCLKIFQKLGWFTVEEKFIHVVFSKPLSCKNIDVMQFKLLKDEHPVEAVRRMSLSGEPKLW